jgi:phosphoglycerol transferase MdoB-like AlkP superfamily enzyme
MSSVISLLKNVSVRFVAPRFKISLIVLAYLMVWYTLLRLGFLIANHRFFTEVGTGEIIKSFIYGWRFDLAALLMINGPLLLLYNLPFKWPHKRWLGIAALTLFCVLNLSFITLNLAEYGNFAISQRRLMSELYTSLNEILIVLPSTLIDYYYLWILLAALVAFFIFTSRYIFKKMEQGMEQSFSFLRSLIWFLSIGLLMWPGIKGGLQRKPIRQAHAFWSSQNRITGYLTLNSSFTVLKSFSQADLRQHHFLPEDVARTEVTKMLCQANEQMLDPAYPFLRQKSFVGLQPRRLNIVIFMMESWTADYIGSISGQQPSATPFFDSLAASGTLFTNFLATGHRSVIAIPSIFDSIPGFYTDSGKGKGNSFVESQSESNNYIGLGNILLRLGYTTSCHHGANVGALGLDTHSRLSGFLNYYGLQDYLKAGGQERDTVWGVWDEDFFQDMIHRIDGFKEPFCSIVFSLTSHEPFRIPERRQSLFDQYKNENKFSQVLRYTDYSIEQFFNVARTKPWFKDTIFIITADHASHSGLNNFYSCFHIPLLIYAPGIVRAQRIDRVGMQVDILPTILDLLHISTIHSSMGASMLDTQSPHFAVVTDGTMYAIFDNQHALLNDLEKTVGLYNYRQDPLFKNNLQARYPDETKRLEQLLYSYIQEASYAIAKNKICREKDIK